MHFSPTKKLGCALTSVPSFTLLFQAKTVKKNAVVKPICKTLYRELSACDLKEIKSQAERGKAKCLRYTRTKSLKKIISTKSKVC